MVSQEQQQEYRHMQLKMRHVLMKMDYIGLKIQQRELLNKFIVLWILHVMVVDGC